MYKFIIDNWKDILTYIVTMSSVFCGVIKYHSPKKRFLRELKFVQEYLSKDKLKQLSNELPIVRDMTLRLFPDFRGMSFHKVEKLLQVELRDNNFFSFLDLYKKEWVNDELKITKKGNKLRNRKYDIYGLWLLFILWCLGLSTFLGVYFPYINIISSYGIILAIMGVGIPEFILLNYLDKRRILKEFKFKN